jgi:hypothetical protein
MQRIVPIVEGDGDTQAVPRLISRILEHYAWSNNWYVGTPIKANGLNRLKKKLQEYLEYSIPI